MLESLRIDPQIEADRIALYVRDRLERAGKDRLVVGLSGGVDSAATLRLSVDAVGADRVRVMLLPNGPESPEAAHDARMLAESLGVSHSLLDIGVMVTPLVARYPLMNETRRAEIISRCRMIALFDQASHVGGLVVGTRNRTETLLGGFTAYGVGAGSLEPIAHLFKCQVWALARHLNLPRTIVERTPSADLWRGETVKGERRFSYADADDILFLITERGLTPEQVVAGGTDWPAYAPDTVDAVVSRMRATENEHGQPPVLRQAM